MQTLIEVKNDWLNLDLMSKVVFGNTASGKTNYLVNECNRFLNYGSIDLKFIQPHQESCLPVLDSYKAVYEIYKYRRANGLTFNGKKWKEEKANRVKLIHDDFDFSLRQIFSTKKSEFIFQVLSNIGFDGRSYGIDYSLSISTIKSLVFDPFCVFNNTAFIYLGDSFLNPNSLHPCVSSIRFNEDLDGLKEDLLRVRAKDKNSYLVFHPFENLKNSVQILSN